jgi:tight adherence protein C
VILVLIGAVAALVVGSGGSQGPDLNSIGVGGMAFLLFLAGPTVWLQRKVRDAQDAVRKALPDALDMLSVCASAGLGFDQALQRVSDYWNNKLAEEFKRVVHEMEVGVSRADALRNLSNRLDVTELSNFVAVIVQAETLGMRIADVLHSQAEQMRILRQFRAKEVANTLPAKMMVPLAMLILPALIAVILGPLVPTFIDAMGNL